MSNFSWLSSCLCPASVAPSGLLYFSENSTRPALGFCALPRSYRLSIPPSAPGPVINTFLTISLQVLSNGPVRGTYHLLRGRSFTSFFSGPFFVPPASQGWPRTGAEPGPNGLSPSRPGPDFLIRP